MELNILRNKGSPNLPTSANAYHIEPVMLTLERMRAHEQHVVQQSYLRSVRGYRSLDSRVKHAVLKLRDQLRKVWTAVRRLLKHPQYHPPQYRIN